MSIKGQKPKVYDFLMSLDFGVCHGVVDSFNEIRFRDKIGWVGPAVVDGSTYIEKNELFGGDDGGEGGVSGTVEFYLGRDVQKMSAGLASRFELTPDTAPGYRGLAHMFFHGSRPPGAEVIRPIGSPAIAQAWSSGFDNEPDEPAEYSVWPPQAGNDVYLDEDDIFAEQIDSELASIFIMQRLRSSSGGSQTWAGGIRLAFYDASGTLISSDGVGADPAGVVGGVGKTDASGTWQIPPLTRQIRYRGGITRNYIEDDSATYAEITFAQGWLTNYFGDLFELDDLEQVDKARGFKWSTNNPYLQLPTVNLTRLPKGLDSVPNFIDPIVGVNESGAYIIANTSSGTERFVANEDRKTAVLNNNVIEPVLSELFGPGFTRKGAGGNKAANRRHLPDANPAHIIYECMTNVDWGKGDPPEAFNEASYVAAAETLADEHFGLSLMWNGQDKIENFVSEVLDHIKAMQFQDPATGLWNLKLLRDDYDPEDCPVFDESNCTVHDVKTRLWGETINKIIVTYTDPESEEETTVEEVNLANVAIQGGPLPDTRDYHAVRNPWLAKIIARRDLAESSAILTSLTVKAPRSAGAVKPGDVIRVTWPRHNVDGLFRVNEVDPGSSKNKTMTFKVVQDVFSVTTTARAVNPVSVPSNPYLEGPEDIEEAAFIPIPYYLLTESERDEIVDDEGLTAIFAHDDTTNYADITVYYVGTNSVGSDAFIEAARLHESSFFTLTSALDAEVRTNISGDAIRQAAGELEIADGAKFFIGEDWDTHEIIAVESYDWMLDQYVCLRGVHDTIPREHNAGERIRKAARDGDHLFRDVGEVVTYSLCPRTFGGDRLDPYIATTFDYTVEARHALPFRPANTQLDGNDLFEDVQYLAGSVPTELELTWANRNRDAELGPIIAFDAGNVTGEVGQTTTIVFRGGDGYSVVDHIETGLTGTSVTVDVNDLPSYRFYEVEFIAERDGLQSFHNVRINLELERLGFGNNFGYDFGENDGD